MKSPRSAILLLIWTFILKVTLQLLDTENIQTTETQNNKFSWYAELQRQQKSKDIFKACVSKQLVWYSIYPTIYIFLPLVLTDVFSHGRGGGAWAKDVYQAVHQINSLIHMIWSDTIKTHHITSVSKGSTCQVEGIHKVNLTNGLFKSKFLVHFRNNRLLRWPRFLFWNSFPLSCRAQILTKRSLMAFLLFKTSQSSSSHPQFWVELCGEYSFQPSHPHKSQNCSFKTQFRKQTLCLEYSEPTK